MGNSGSKKSGASAASGGGGASAASAASSSATGARTIPSVFADSYSDLPTLQADLRKAGLEGSNLIVAIDATKSNEWTGAKTFGGRNLHTIGSELNPYQQALMILGQTLSAFDEDNMVPGYLFGAAGAGDHSLVSLLPGDRPCHGIDQVLQAYSQVIPHIKLAGPTSFAAIIRKAVETTVAAGNTYHILIIVADGVITRSSDLPPDELSAQEEDTFRAVQEASQYPLSIIIVGVGDGENNWEAMRTLDDRIPGRKVDNLQFIPMNEVLTAVQHACTKGGISDPARVKSAMEATFALNALMEIPSQYKAINTLRMMGATGTAPKRPMAAPVRVLEPPVAAVLSGGPGVAPMPVPAYAPAPAPVPSHPAAYNPASAMGGAGMPASAFAVPDGHGGTVVIVGGGAPGGMMPAMAPMSTMTTAPAHGSAPTLRTTSGAF